MNVADRMRDRLSALAPERVDILDESAKHAGHEGAKGGGGHYRLTVVSSRFAGKPTLARHRMVYDALGDMMGTDIHALRVKAYTPGESDS